MKLDLSEYKNNSPVIGTENIDGIEVKTYLPYLEKISFAETVLRNTIRIDDETGMAYDAFCEDLYLTVGILKSYTDIEFDDADNVFIYDHVIRTGLMAKICAIIGEDLDRTKELYYHMRADILRINMQQISATQILKGLVDIANSKDFADAFSNMKLESESMLNVLGRAQQPASLLNFAKK